MKQLMKKVGVVVVMASPLLAHATGTDYTGITGAVDWTAVSTNIVTILGDGAAVIVVFLGGKLLLRAIKGAA